MKINFILPFIEKSGGVIVVLEHAKRLAAKGHVVRVYYPLFPYSVFLPHLKPWTLRYMIHQGKAFLFGIFRHFKGIALAPPGIRLVALPAILPFLIRNADATVATAWPTALDVAHFKKAKGKKFYFVQDYEDWSNNTELLDATYRLPLELIVISPWLSELMQNKFHRKVFAEVHNGINLDVFHPGVERDWSKPSILFMYHRLANKGLEDLFQVLQKVRVQKPEIEIRSFGVFDLPPKWDFVKYHKNPTQESLVRLYQNATIFIAASRRDGWGLPITEAMACGCATVVTKTGCVEVLDNGNNMLVSAPEDTEGLYKNLTKLLENSSLTESIAKAGLGTIRLLGWDAPSLQMEAALLGSVQPN